MKRKILLVVSTRPNFMKVAPILARLRGRPDLFDICLVHTGQHYDALLSDVFFDDLDLPPPDHHLGAGSGTHGVADGAHHGRLRPGPDRGGARSRRRRGGRDRHHGLRPRRGEAPRPGGPRGGRPAQPRPPHAGGDQPHRHRRRLRLPVHALPGRRRQPARRGHPRGADPPRRQRHGGLPAIGR